MPEEKHHPLTLCGFGAAAIAGLTAVNYPEIGIGIGVVAVVLVAIGSFKD